MVKTGDWATADLVKYLVGIKERLSGIEMDRLKATSAFRKEGETSAQPPRFRASDLYEPQETLRQLTLPIIDWGPNLKWKAGSAEGARSLPCLQHRFTHYSAAHFLASIGLRRFPPLKVLIDLCGNTDPIVRHVALKYFLDNYQARYSDYNPDNFPNIAFIPALDRSIPRMAVHKEANHFKPYQ